MGTIIDFETGKATETDPPCECSDGYGLENVDWNAHENAIKEKSAFPYAQVIIEGEGGYLWVQVSHEEFIRIELTILDAMQLACDLSEIAARKLRHSNK